MAATTPSDPFGVYVHVPFCSHRCDYCAFATWTDRSHLMDRYAAACATEAALLAERGRPPATSVFFGGGTPSLLDPALLVDILAAIPRAPDAEVTVECNPENVSVERLRHYQDGGVTRLSFGVQSLLPHVLTSLGRRHEASGAQRAARAAADTGFAETYSIDLIMGAAGESLGDWCRTLETVLALDPAPRHVSAYGLTVEAGTPLARDPSRHPDPDDQADKYLRTEQILSDGGLDWYEISNWAAPGAECAHNQLYWAQGDYVGIGCAAHSHEQLDGERSRRWWNLHTPERYCAAVEAGRPTEAAGETLDAGERRIEGLQLALRTRHGVPAEALGAGGAMDPLLVGLVGPVADRLVLTPRGRLLANEVALRLSA